MSDWQYFFDVPVYRVSEEDYEKEWMRSPSKKTLDENEKFYQEYPDQKIHAQIHLRKDFGGAWKYNEIIGYIRLYRLGRQIRGEWHVSDAKRHVRSRRKIIENTGNHKLADEIYFHFSDSNEKIFDTILDYLKACQKKLGKKRYLDSSVLQVIGPCMDWKKLFFQNTQENVVLSKSERA